MLFGVILISKILSFFTLTVIIISLFLTGCNQGNTKIEDFEAKLSLEDFDKAKGIVGEEYINKKINEGKIKRVGDQYYVDLAFKGSRRYYDFNMLVIDPDTGRDLVSDLKTPENLDYCRNYLNYRGFPEDQKNTILNNLISKDSFSKVSLNEIVLSVITTQAQTKEIQQEYTTYLNKLPPNVSDYLQIKFPQPSNEAIIMADLLLRIFDNNKLLKDNVVQSDFEYNESTSSITLVMETPFEKSYYTDNGKDAVIDRWSRYLSGSLAEDYWNLDKDNIFEVKKIYLYDSNIWKNFSNFEKEYRNTGEYPITTDYYKECVLYDYKKDGSYGIIIGVISGHNVYKNYGSDKYYPFEAVIDFYGGKTNISDINYLYDQYGTRNKALVYIDPELPETEATDAKIEDQGKIVDEIVRLLMAEGILVPTVPEEKTNAPPIQIN